MASRPSRVRDLVGRLIGSSSNVAIGIVVELVGRIVVDSVNEHLVQVLVHGILAASLALGHFALFHLSRGWYVAHLDRSPG